MTKLIKHVVRMDNVLIHARHGLTLPEKRLISLAISKATPKKLTTDIKINAKEFSDAFGVNRKIAYRDLKNACNELYERSIDFRTRDSLKRMRWVSGAEYQDKDGYVVLSFNHKLVPLLFNLKSKFTQYELLSTQSLRTTNSWRLMELLERFKNSDILTHDGYNFFDASLTDLYLAFDATDTYKKFYGKFKQAVINPAVKELNNKTNWIVCFEEMKHGRKVIRLKFKFRKKYIEFSD